MKELPEDLQQFIHNQSLESYGVIEFVKNLGLTEKTIECIELDLRNKHLAAIQIDREMKLR